MHRSLAALAAEKGVFTPFPFTPYVRGVTTPSPATPVSCQENVLRAVAHESTGWARASVLQQFALGNPSRVSKTIDTLCERTTLLREGDQVLFDDPFYRAWVIVSTLPDVGLRLPVTHVPGESRQA
jgi:hypothetical protein